MDSDTFQDLESNLMNLILMNKPTTVKLNLVTMKKMMLFSKTLEPKFPAPITPMNQSEFYLNNPFLLELPLVTQLSNSTLLELSLKIVEDGLIMPSVPLDTITMLINHITLLKTPGELLGDNKDISGLPLLPDKELAESTLMLLSLL